MQLAFDSDVTLGSRFEFKYIVSPTAIPAMREFIHPFLVPDAFAARWAGNRYPISSLYLDSQDLKLYQQTVGGEKNRFKLRVRTYDDDPKSPAYFEVKRKINNIVSKRRTPIGRHEAAHFVTQGMNGWSSGLPLEPNRDLEYFALHSDLTDARPLIRVKYMREAYESRSGEPVRITVDTDLMHAVTLDYDLSHTSGRWVTTQVSGTILELKFTERYPEWLSDFARAFGLKQQPVPKYVLSVDHLMTEGRESALTIGGFSLPPRRA